MPQVIDGIILAAGKSERFGQPKVLQTFLGESFVTRIITHLRDVGVRNISLVLGYRAGEFISQIPQSGFPFIVINKQYESGQFSSLQAGVKTIGENISGVLMTLVDCPHISSQVYQSVYDVAQSNPEKVIIPTYQTQGGHPIYLPKPILGKITQASATDNLRDLLRQEQNKIHRIELNEPGLIRDIDTPEDLFALEQLYSKSLMKSHLSEE